MPDRTFFYAPVVVEQGESFILGNSQYNHIVNVLRMGPGDTLEVVNGRGLIIRATISHLEKKRVHCRAEAVEQSRNELSVHITLAVGLIKQQRYEWMVEKATELGVARIQPLLTDRVVRTGLRPERLEKKAIAAMMQSERAVLPAVESPQSLETFLDWLAPENTFVAAQELDKTSILDLFTHNQLTNAIILIGPEGGWSQAELEQFARKDLHSFQLGRRRLRTETAAVTALSQLSIVLESSVMNT